MLRVQHLVVFALLVVVGHALDNGVARRPVLGWSTWNTFRLNINETLVRESADTMVSSGLKDAGYEYILIDDGWPACLLQSESGKCLKPAPRLSDGQIPVNKTKFPSGFKALSDYVHSKGLKIGIYTAVSKTTCGGYTASLGYEAIDAKSFADWGFDFVKHDTCNEDCGIHDGCIPQSTGKMRDGLNASGRPIVYYIDAGNPSSPQRLYNPYRRYVSDVAMIKVADKPSELVWRWGPSTANMWKSWFDRSDTWSSLLDNLHHNMRNNMFQTCGAYNMPDMLTVGQGGMSQGQYRAEFFLWSVMGSPLILGCDIRVMDSFTKDLVTNTEILAVDQDPDCVQGSMVHARGSIEVWMKPLHDSTFAAVVLNKGSQPANGTIYFNSHFQNEGDLYPANIDGLSVHVRDLYLHEDIGLFNTTFSTEVDGLDAKIFRLTVQSQQQPAR